MPLSKINRPGLNTGIADSSDATAITIDSSEQVGIGTATPAKPLTVDGGSDYNVVLRSASTRSGLVMHTPGTGSLGGPAASALLLADNTFRLGTTNHYNIVMDQSGRVTMPQQPMFRVGRFTDYSHTAGHLINWNHSWHNVGSHMNTSSTYVFTAPVAGVYWFQATVIINALANGTNLYDALRFKINGAFAGYSSRRGIYNTTSMSSGYFVDEIADSYQLAANDTVGVSCEWGIQIHGNNLYTRFNGFLVG